MHDDKYLARALSGDETAFSNLIEPHRLPLFRHCYRMLGSGPEAEEALQDALLRAWQKLATFEERGSFQGWMYRIATNICIDRLRGRQRRVHPVAMLPPVRPGAAFNSAASQIEPVEPVADESVGIGIDPINAVMRRERVSLAFVAALQRLSPRQRAALLLHDVLEFTQDEVAGVLDTSKSAVNSLLYRARQTIGTPAIIELGDPQDPAVIRLVERYVRAWELADISQFLNTISDDVRFSMPPLTQWFQGAGDVAEFVESSIFRHARPFGVPMAVGRANGQPALATYEPDSGGGLVVNGLQVLEISGTPARVRSITSFRDPRIAIQCGLPPRLPSPQV